MRGGDFVMVVRVIPLVAVIWPGVVMADDFAKRRATCAPVVTALYDDCTLQNIYRCADGSTYIESLDEFGDLFASLFGPDFETIYQVDAVTGTGIENVVRADDPFSFDALIADGQEASREVVTSSMIPGTRMESDMYGKTRMTPERRSYSTGTFVVATTSQSLEVGFGGNSAIVDAEYLIDPDRRLMVEGNGSASFAGAAIPMPSLTDIIGPDHPFFMSQSPLETCQDQLSFLIPDPALQVETPHDNL
jgi:hypothetical protein